MISEPKHKSFHSPKILSQYSLPYPFLNSSKGEEIRSLSQKDTKQTVVNQQRNTKLKKIEEYLNIFPESTKSKDANKTRLNDKLTLESLVEARLDWKRTTVFPSSSSVQIPKNWNIQSDIHNNTQKIQENDERAQKEDSTKKMRNMNCDNILTNSQISNRQKLLSEERKNSYSQTQDFSMPPPCLIHLPSATITKTSSKVIQPLILEKEGVGEKLSLGKNHKIVVQKPNLLIDKNLTLKHQPQSPKQNLSQTQFSSFQLLNFIQPTPKLLSSSKGKFEPFEESRNFFTQINNSKLNEFKWSFSIKNQRDYSEGKRKKSNLKASKKVIQGPANIKNVDDRSNRLIQFSMKVSGEKQVIRERFTPDKYLLYPEEEKQVLYQEGRNSQVIETSKTPSSQQSSPLNRQYLNQRLRSNSMHNGFPINDCLNQMNVKPSKYQQYHQMQGTKYIETNGKQHLQSQCNILSKPSPVEPNQFEENNTYFDDYDICQYVEERNNQNTNS